MVVKSLTDLFRLKMFLVAILIHDFDIEAKFV